MQPRVAALCAYGLAVLSIVYALMFAMLRTAIANDLTGNVVLAVSGVLASVATVGVADLLPDRPGRWVRLVGVGWALLSAAHGAEAAAAAWSGVALATVSATDPRGFATFFLTGLWTLVVGGAIRAGGTPFPRALGLISIATGADLIVLYAATFLGILPVVTVTAVLGALILIPVYWVWSGRILAKA